MLLKTAPCYNQKRFYFMVDVILVVCADIDTGKESSKPNSLVTRVGEKVSHGVPWNLNMSSKGLAWHQLGVFFGRNVPRRRKLGPVSCSMGKL